MKFSVGSIFGRKAEQEGPRVVSRSNFGAEFPIGFNESIVVEDMMVTSKGISNGNLNLDIKTGERNGSLGLVLKQEQGAKVSQPWYEYVLSFVSLDQNQRPKLVVKKVCQNAKPMTYDSDFWLRAGECAAFEHGFMIRAKSISRSRQGEFTNTVLELEHVGQKKEVTLVSFAKGKEKFVFAQTKNSASFGPFSIMLKSASESDVMLNVQRSNELFV